MTISRLKFRNKINQLVQTVSKNNSDQLHCPISGLLWIRIDKITPPMPISTLLKLQAVMFQVSFRKNLIKWFLECQMLLQTPFMRKKSPLSFSSCTKSTSPTQFMLICLSQETPTDTPKKPTKFLLDRETTLNSSEVLSREGSGLNWPQVKAKPILSGPKIPKNKFI